MKSHKTTPSFSPLVIVRSLMTHRQLIASLIQREVMGRYQGSLGGIFWSLLTPILMLLVYTFVFGLVFKARFSGTGDLEANFGLALFIALIVFGIFSECLTKSASLIISNVNFVKKIVFPLELLPLITIGASFFHAAVSFVVWLCFYMIVMGTPGFTILLFPFLLIPIAAFSLGTLWLLSSLGVYLRDIDQFIGVFTTALMFLSAVFYPISSLPEAYQSWMHLNPFAVLIDQSRTLLIWGEIPDLFTYAKITIISLLYAWLGFVCFQKLRKGFADVI